MRQDFLPFSPPSIGEEEIQEVVDTLKTDWISAGPKTRQFESQFAEHVQSPAALALNSCTAGLHTALLAHGIGPGDEVITTPMTFCASVNVIEHTGAKPVLVDVQPDTLNICPKNIEAAITSKTKAIIPVHYAGHPVDLADIQAIANQHDIPIIEDAAHAIGASYDGVPIGGHGNAAAFSFYATKNITTGEGGMLSGDEEFLAQARVISLHGMSREAWKRYEKGGTWKYDVVAPGFKYNMNDIQASMGMWQLRKLEKFQQRRREVVQMYNEAFAGLDAIETPVTRGPIQHAWHLYVIRLREETLNIQRDAFIDSMKDRKIGTSVHFIPIHLHSHYSNKYGYSPEDYPVANDAYSRMFSLPLNARMSDQDVADVIEAVTDIATQNARRKAA